MPHKLDRLDKRILARLQEDASLSLNDIAEAVGLSRNATWARIRQMQEKGIIVKRVCLLDPEALNVGLTVFITVRTSEHSLEWLERFRRACRAMPEIIAIYRTTGETDYLLQAVVPSVKAYDALYQRLITEIPLSDVSPSFVMEEIKRTTALPLDYV
jgi:Lrp/AsnC family transcriptional regulator